MRLRNHLLLKNCIDYAFFHCFLVKFTKIHGISNFEHKNRKKIKQLLRLRPVSGCLQKKSAILQQLICSSTFKMNFSFIFILSFQCRLIELKNTAGRTRKEPFPDILNNVVRRKMYIQCDFVFLRREE